jgi:branched-chain amino acid transport system substrate-binding protein
MSRFHDMKRSGTPPLARHSPKNSGADADIRFPAGDRKAETCDKHPARWRRREDAMRRLFPLCVAALLICSNGFAQAQISDDVVKIGVLTDLSGPSATADGPGSVTAAQMAVDDFGGQVLGKPITVISADHQLKPDIASGIASRWYDVDQVDLIVDVPVSAVGLAVQHVATEKKKLLIVHSTGTADFHGKFCTPYAVQWVFDTRALAVGTAQEVTKRGGDSWFFLTADYAFGHALERDASQVVAANGGKVLGAVRHPFATPDLHRSFSRRRPRRRRSSGSPAVRPTTSTPSSSAASSASSRAASRWPVSWC